MILDTTLQCKKKKKPVVQAPVFRVFVCRNCGKVIKRVQVLFKKQQFPYVFPLCSEECEDEYYDSGKMAAVIGEAV